MRAKLLWLLLACSCTQVEEAPPKEQEPPQDTGPPSPSTGEVRVQGGCAVQPDNVLRYDCTFTLPAPGPLTVTVEGGGRTRTLEGSTATLQHEMTVFLLTPQTDYIWSANSGPDVATGGFTTGPLPAAVDLRATVTGSGTTDSIVIPFQCGAPGHLVAINERGDVEWYQDMTQELGEDLNSLSVTGFDATTESAIALLHHSHITEFDWRGRPLGSASLGTDYDLPTHHSVYRRDGKRFVLNAEAYPLVDGTYLLDGVYIFDTAWSVLGSWSLRDLLTPSGGGMPGGYWGAEFPGAIDFSHSNSIYVDEQGDWILSMRGLHTVIKVRGDLDAPDFGALMWSLSSTAWSPFGTDYLVTSAGGITAKLDFSDQHHAHFEDDGGLWVFDNRGFGEHSRGIRMSLDDTFAVADIDRSLDLPERCSVQSSVYRLPNEHALLTCATSQTLYEFDTTSPDPIWQATVTCGEDGRAPTTHRGQPIFW